MPLEELRRVEPQQRAVIEQFITDCPVRLGAMARELGLSIKISSMDTGYLGKCEMKMAATLSE